MESSFGVFERETLRQGHNGDEAPASEDPYDFHLGERESRQCGLSGDQGYQSAFIERIDYEAELLMAELVKHDEVGASDSGAYSFDTGHELTAFLSSLEVLLRMFFLDSTNKALFATLLRFRGNFTTLQKTKVIGLEHGKYPEVYILYELFSLRKMLLNWEAMTTEDRRMITKTAINYMTYVRSPEYALLEDLLRVADGDLNAIGNNIGTVLKCLDDASSSTPYGFPHVCKGVLLSSFARLPCPSGILMIGTGDPPGDAGAPLVGVKNPLVAVSTGNREKPCTDNNIARAGKPMHRNR